MTQNNTSDSIEQMLARHITRLRAALQRVSGESSGPEEGSDAWLLLNALTSKDTYDTRDIAAHFEQSGRWLVEQGGRLDIRLSSLQKYITTIATECKEILPPERLIEVFERLYRLQSLCALALLRGYQSVTDQLIKQSDEFNQRLEQRLMALQRINGISNSAMDLDQTLEITAQIIAEELNSDLCSIFFYDELQRVLTLRATNGPRPLGGMHFTLRLGEGYSGWVAEKGRVLLVRDVMEDAGFASEARAYTDDYHGLLALPIIFFGSTEHLIGVISIQSCEEREFTRDEISFVEVAAGIIAINIENGRLYEQTDEQLRRKVHELATIHRVSSLIPSTLNLDEVLQVISTQAVHLSGAERSCIFELDPDRQRLHAIAYYGFNSNLASRVQIGVGQCCAGQSVQTGRPSMAVDCFQADENCFMHNDPLITSDIHSVLCIPLKAREKILGCICIYSSHRHLLSPEQMQLVVTFANEAAIAIENARLYEETRRGLELKSVLLRELNHRVKNNLATVASILALQRRRARSSETRNILAESINRVQGLAATHDLLAHEDIGEARVDDIVRKIVGVAHVNLSPPDKHITFQVEPCPVVIPARSVSVLALVVNEMISNAIKHGMADQSRGSIVICGREEEGVVIVQVIDSGKGPGTELYLEEKSEIEGLGLSLIRNLIADLRGSFSLRREVFDNPPGGRIGSEQYSGEPVERTVAEVRFPLRRSRASGVSL
ncbi:MAG: GAF domain-containing protein [Ktedonobacteraceae bacterium]|nr:GAF domain-containing protein [Ktedonobacteraceae bacterium]